MAAVGVVMAGHATEASFPKPSGPSLPLRSRRTSQRGGFRSCGRLRTPRADAPAARGRVAQSTGYEGESMSGHLLAAPKRVRLRLLWIGVAVLLLAALLPGQASAQGNACENAQQQHLRQAVGVRDAGGRARASGSVPSDRRRQRRSVLPGYARCRYRGLRRQRRVRRRVAGGRRLRRDARPGRDHVQLPGGAPPVDAGPGDLRDRRLHREWLGDRRGAGHPGGHQPHPAPGLDQRLRGGGLRRDRLER